ncbi:MAG: hypothetical protein IT495_12145, partial [Gammaproteobacteria bacterium]|nr:hypothetical protein [Gammaproteobacteria bacterium]
LTVALAVLAAGSLPVMALAGLAAAVWVAWTSVQTFAGQWRKYGAAARAVANMPRGFHGMTLAHFGVALFIVGVTCASVWSADKDIRMAPGERYTLADYTFEFVGVSKRQGPNFTAERGEVRVSRDEQPLTTLYPEKRQYASSGQPMTEAGIDAGVARDLYVSLGEPVGGGAWTLRLHVKPFVRWIWFGPLLMAFGGLVAATDRRYRVGVRAARGATIPGAVTAAG